MRRIITLTALALGLTGGVAAADRDRHRGGPTVRDHRSGGHVQRAPARPSNNQRFTRGGGTRVVNHNHGVRRPIYVNRDNRFYFSAGVSRPLYRPVINYHYRSYAQRPALIVENYDPYPGYIWVAGDWQWNGYEWMWISGHYEVDTSYDDTGYYQGY